jgi:hypothetical protein
MSAMETVRVTLLSSHSGAAFRVKARKIRQDSLCGPHHKQTLQANNRGKVCASSDIDAIAEALFYRLNANPDVARDASGLVRDNLAMTHHHIGHEVGRGIAAITDADSAPHLRRASNRSVSRPRDRIRLNGSRLGWSLSI